jgi:glycosyltransferase involved in cell wall biosynthesis
VLSESLREPYTGRLGGPADRVVALPNPVEWPATLPPVDPTGPVTALFLGRFGARKGIYDLIDACARLAPEHRRRLRLVAAGDGEIDEVRDAITDAGVADVVEVAPWLDRADRDDLLRRAQLLVLPSSAEGLPMAVLEAMAFGVVPVVTPVGALPELVHDAVNGVVVPVGDPDALARALETLLADDEGRVALGRHAREDAEAYSAPRWAARLAAIWADAVGPGPQGRSSTKKYGAASPRWSIRPSSRVSETRRNTSLMGRAS